MKALLAKIRAILKDRKARRFWARVISVMASVVVFISTYALILPAITMETVAACGIEAHQHTDDCYEDILVCGQEESEDHQHTEACYEHVLTCGKEAHIHSTECYKEDSTAVAATGGTSVPVIQEDAQSGSPETSGRDAGSAEAVDEGNEDAAGAGRLSDSDSDSQEPDGSADTSGTWDTSALTVNENAADATTKVLPEDLAEEELAGGYVPALEALNFDALLTKETGFYYFHPEEGQPVPENSSDISDWKELKKDTTLASTDLVKAYLAYSIPAGALNETNQIARYRLPANIHLTDDQILAINSTENGIAASYVIPGTETTDDPENYRKYLGAEAVEGTRTPDKALRDGAMEYISAVVKAENVYENTLDENGNYVDAAGNIAEDQGDYLGQDLIFIFTPYTIQKNQNTYDNNGDPIRAGEKVTGWFAVDFNMDQIDWIEQDTDLDNSTIEKSAEIIFAQEDAAAGIKERAETLRLEEPGAALAEAEVVDEDAETESSETENAAEGVTEENAADGAADEAEAEAADESATADTADPEKEEGIEKSLEDKEKEDEADSKKEDEDGTEDKTVFKDGTLTADGDGCHITLDYTAEAQIPEKASLSVKEITPDTDPEAYAACLQQAAKEMGANLADDGGNDRDNAADTADADHSSNADSAGKAGAPTLDTAASRFFDIEIVVTDEEGNAEKIEPKAPVAVNIQLSGTPKAENGAEKDKNDAAQGSSADSAQKADPTVLHFAEEGVEKIESTIDAPASETGAAVQAEDTTAISFEAESFSIYGVVYTVDFHWEVNGKTYDFSIPGGGFVSFEHLAEVLNLAASETDDETAGSLADTANGPEEAASIADEAIRLNEVAVSDRTKQFTACVQDIEFSNPLLADVYKFDTDTTVGQIKADRALEVEYSADLTKEQIDAINEQVIEGGDWVLISEHPFDTEETLTVTMKTGEVFVIKVTDSNFASTVDGKTFALIIANNAKTSGYALDVNVRGDGRFTSRQTNINYLGETVNEEVYFCDNVNSIKWTFEYIKGSGKQFKLKANNGQYLHYENGRFSLSNEPTILYADVTPGDNDHVRLCLDEGLHNAINLYGGNNGFGIWGNGSNDPNEKFTLCKPFDMSTNTPGTITTVDNNAEGIELKLFDYDYIATPGTTGDLDKEGNRIYGDDLGSSYNISVNTGKKFWFLGWGSSSNETDPGINDFTGLGDNIRALQGIVKNNLVGGYPELAVDQNGNATNDSLAYLFDGTANDTKSYTANHLFEKIGDKYSYDSNKHYAEFNKTTGNFTVYDGTLEQNSGADKQYAKNDKAVGFFPFDSYSDMKGLYDNNRLYLNPNISENDQRKSNGQHYRMNHHNGMSLDAHFRMPEAGKDSYGNDIEFEFSGDDDLWVYIDDVLVLDIGGVHQPLNGKINFTTGEVTVDAAVETDGVSSSAIAGASTTIEEMFRKAGKTYDPHKLHEMKVFWIERGGCDSNCKIEFNLPLTTTKEAGAVTFDKVSALNQSLKLEGAVFTLYTDPACTTPLLIGNVPVTATSGEDGVVNFYAIPTGDYYVKETTFPEGYAAKDPEEIFTVHVAKDTTSRPLINGAEVNPVTNEPKKISVDVEKVWENGIIPDGAAIEIVLGRYRLVEDPNAQGKGTLVIRDSYTGLPTGSNYNVTYTITGPDNYSNTIRKSYADTSKDIEISVPNLPAGVQYTVTKTVAGISHYNTNNGSGTQTAIVPKKGSVDVRFSQSTFTRNAYKVTIYSLDKKVNVNTWVAAKYYPANSSLYLRGSYKNDSWARGRRFQYSFDNSTFKDFQIEQNGQWNQTGRTEQFTLNQDIDIYIRTKESDNDANSWTKDYDWFVNPTINGANPVSTNSAGRMMMASPARAAANVLSQTAPAPTLPVPPKDTVYELDAEYAADPGKITLSGNTWTGSIGDLYADNEYGPYVYYIAQVNETGMPEGTQITISDEVSLDGDAKVLTVTNNVPTGDLKITKTIQKNGQTDTSATGTFYYAVYSEAYNPEASPAQTPVRTGSIEVSSNGTQTVTETDLICGTYYVYELNGKNGTPIVSGNDGSVQVIGGICYTVTGSGSTANVGSNAGSAVLTNNQETVDITATKQWQDKNGTVLTGTNIPTNAKVTFTLLADGTATSHTVEVNGVDDTAGGVTPATADYEGANWTAYFTGLPKYTNAGTLINYTVQETGTWDGYVVDGNATVSSGGTIINKQQTVEINILKVDKTDGTTPLTGAKFVLKRYNEGYHGVQETWPEQTVSSEEEKKGTLIIDGLTVGYYELEETESPAGYIRISAFPRFEVAVNPTTKELEVIFTDNTGGMVSYDSTNNEFTVRNEPGAALPNTGGPGTSLLYLLGIMLTGIAGVGLVMRKRRRGAA